MTLQLHIERRPFPKEVRQALQVAWSEFVCRLFFVDLSGDSSDDDSLSFVGLGPRGFQWCIT